MTAEEPSRATSTASVHPKDAALRHCAQLKRSLEQLDLAAAAVVAELHLEPRMLPAEVYKSAPGTYARHAYNILREVAGR